MLPYYKNILLVSGNGRNVGKTTLTCRFIKQFSHCGIVSVKVSPHWHTFNHGEQILFLDDNLLVMEETNASRNKDSGRMLLHGASKVYYVQSRRDAFLHRAFNLIIENEGAHKPMVFESAALGKFIKPAFHFHVKRPLARGDKKQLTHSPADHILHFDGKDFNFDLERVRWADGKWEVAS